MGVLIKDMDFSLGWLIKQLHQARNLGRILGRHCDKSCTLPLRFHMPCIGKDYRRLRSDGLR
jgi:hypothetical protein